MSQLSPTTVAPTRLNTVEKRVLVLLVLSVGINYIDRGTLSVAAPQLTREMALDPEKMGLLLSGFFWTYAVCQILGGWLVDRYNVRWVYGIGFVLWSGATLATGLISTFAALFALRLLLGLGESVAYPSYSKIIAGTFPQTHRGIANSLVDMGSKIGPALGTLIGGLVVAQYGWRSLFLVLGGGSLLWLIPWVIWGPRDHAVEVAERVEPPGISRCSPASSVHIFPRIAATRGGHPAHCRAGRPGRKLRDHPSFCEQRSETMATRKLRRSGRAVRPPRGVVCGPRRVPRKGC